MLLLVLEVFLRACSVVTSSWGVFIEVAVWRILASGLYSMDYLRDYLRGYWRDYWSIVEPLAVLADSIMTKHP